MYVDLFEPRRSSLDPGYSAKQETTDRPESRMVLRHRYALTVVRHIASPFLPNRRRTIEQHVSPRWILRAQQQIVGDVDVALVSKDVEQELRSHDPCGECGVVLAHVTHEHCGGSGPQMIRHETEFEGKNKTGLATSSNYAVRRDELVDESITNPLVNRVVPIRVHAAARRLGHLNHHQCVEGPVSARDDEPRGAWNSPALEVHVLVIGC